VRYIKNGRKGKWWPAAKPPHNQLHAGWNDVPDELLYNPDYAKIIDFCPNTQDCNALMTLLDHPSKHVWVTFEDLCLWWCLVNDGVTILGPSTDTHGHFFIKCADERPWSNKSLGGRKLNISDIPGPITSTAGFRGTVCKPQASDQILRLLRDEKNPAVVAGQRTREDYQAAVQKMVKQLHWKDFELLIGLIFDQTGWARLSRIGGSQKSIDLDVKNWASEERAFVQVKSEASQADLHRSIDEFKDSPHYQRMVFAVHKPSAHLRTDDPNVHIWADARLAELVVQLGLGLWLETKLA